VLILADEPTGQLDTATGQEVITALVEGADHHGAALVICTHDREVAVRLEKRWALIDGHLSTQMAASGTAASP
jgi:putative ABC transport system ATP-binding protein